MRGTTLVLVVMMILISCSGGFFVKTSVARPIQLWGPHPNGNETVAYNPRLSVTVGGGDDLLHVTFKSNASGSWQILGTYVGGAKKYGQNTTHMDAKNKTYYWSINVTDGTNWTNGTYSFVVQPFAIKWRGFTHVNTSIAPLAVDVNNDGIYEIFVTGRNDSKNIGRAFCLNGSNGKIIWQYNNSQIDYHSPFELGDLNNDGIPEMVISCNETTKNNGITIALHANNGKVYWIANHTESGGKYPCIADIEGNGYPYVYICSGDFSHGVNGSGRIRKLRGTDGTILAETFVWRPCWGGISVADADNDGKFEVYMAERCADYHNEGQLSLGMQCFDAETLKLLWYQDALTCSSHCTALVDVNHDGVLDAVNLDQGNGGVYIVDGATWDKMPGYWQSRVPGLSPHSPFPIYDIDNDGKLEIVVAKDGPARMWDVGNWGSYIELADFNEPPKMANVIGDENLEIIGASQGVKIYNTHGNLIETIGDSNGGLDTTLVQDVDNDWKNELIILSGDGVLQCYGTSANVSIPRVRTNNQFYSERRDGVGVYVPPPGAPQPIINSVFPLNETQDVPPNPTLCARVIEYQVHEMKNNYIVEHHYDKMNITISTNASGSWTTLASYPNSGNGWYNITSPAMDKTNTTYYWRVTARDSNPQANDITTTETYRFTTSASPRISDINAPSAIVLGQTMNISCTVTDGTSVDTVKANITPPNGQETNNSMSGGVPHWSVLKYDSFESGMGNYSLGGSSSSLYSGDLYSYQGNGAVKIQDYLGMSSSFYLTNPIDADSPRYTSIKVDFWFLALGMTNLSNFWVKYYDGQHWRIVDTYIKPGAQGNRPADKPFANGVFCHGITWINESDYTFPKDMKIRFECDAVGATQRVYIDQVYINATTEQGDRYYHNTTYTQIGTYHYSIWARDTSGNAYRTALRSFQIINSHQPNSPSNPNPSNGSSENPINTDLSWTGGHPENESVTYDVYFGSSASPPKMESNQTQTSYDPRTMNYLTTYYWRIVAWDSKNNSTVGPLWHFTTTSQPSPPGDGGGGGGGQGPPVDQNEWPLANTSAGEPYYGYVNSVIVFDGSRSSDPDGNISKWFWLFGDETNGTGMIVQHIYSKPGTYNVSLTVTDNDGDTNSKTTTCIIAQPNRPPTPPTITGPLHGTRNTMYSYTMVSTDKDNDVLRYAVEWGDSSPPVQSSGFLPDGTSFSVNHSWQNAGRYDITVSASDNQTETSSKITVYIDAEQTGDIGYLMDTNSDGIYDSFYSDITKKITMVQEQNGLYNIDSDGDGTWDYTFNATNGLAVWQAPNTPGFAVVLTLSAITVVLFWKRKSKMKN